MSTAKKKAKRPLPRRREMPKTAERPRALQKAQTRQRVLKAAWELFNRDGYEATTTKAVAERARVAAGTVFVHARDKDELLFLVMTDMLAASVDQGFESVPKGAPFVDQVLHLFRGPVSYYARHPRVARAFLRALPGADGPNAQRLNAQNFAFLQRLSAVVRAASERGELARDIDPLLAAGNVFALYFAGLMAWMSGRVPIDTVLEPMLKNAVGLLVRGLRA